jgi:hypothetical protein
MLLETEVMQASEADLAQALIRLYGRRAEMVAQDHASSALLHDDVQAYCKWWRVRDTISGLRPKMPGIAAH